MRFSPLCREEKRLWVSLRLYLNNHIYGTCGNVPAEEKVPPDISLWDNLLSVKDRCQCYSLHSLRQQWRLIVWVLHTHVIHCHHCTFVFFLPETHKNQDLMLSPYYLFHSQISTVMLENFKTNTRII